MEINSGAKTRTGKPIGTGNPILADPRVREAIALAIDRQKLVGKVLDGNGLAGAGYLPPGYPQCCWQPPASESRTTTRPRPTASRRRRLQGRPTGSGPTRRRGQALEFRLGIHSDDAGDASIAQYLEEWLKAIGIGVRSSR